MALIRPLNGTSPRLGENCFLAETAVLIGDVTLGDHCSVWYGAVLRGDVNPIRLGNRCRFPSRVRHRKVPGGPRLARYLFC